MGFFTALACSLVGSNGRVFSIEPNSQNCTFIEATRKQNNFFWQKTYCVAATETDMIMSLYSSFSNGSVSASIDNIGALIQSRTIQGVSLDGILNLDRLDFIKIDVEGHEFEALKGFRKAIERSRPVIVSEFSASGMLDPNGYLNFLIGMRYSISVVQHDGALHYCGMDAQLVISRFKESGFDHIDFIALPEAP
jgi:FkbM family methyltransferase